MIRTTIAVLSTITLLAAGTRAEDKAKAPAAAPAAPAKSAPAAAAPAAVAPAAAPTAPAGPPTPSPEVEKMYGPFAGSWKCDTTFPAGSMGPGSPEVKTKAKVVIKKDLGGFFYSGTYDVPKGKTTPGMSGKFVLGYESGSKQASVVGFDSMGGMSWGMGPVADILVFTGEGYMMGMKIKVRETMQAKGPKEVAHKWEADMGKGFTVFSSDECKK